MASAHVWATDLATGAPVAGASVTFYDVATLGALGRQPPTPTASPPSASRWWTICAACWRSPARPASPPLASPAATGRRISPWDFGLNGDSRHEPTTFVYLTTDRPIYRPGDTVNFRGVVRQTDYGRYLPPALENVTCRPAGLFLPGRNPEPDQNADPGRQLQLHRRVRDSRRFDRATTTCASTSAATTPPGHRGRVPHAGVPGHGHARQTRAAARRAGRRDRRD